MKSEFFSRFFLERLPEDNDEAIVMLADEYQRLFLNHEHTHDSNHDFIEAYAIVESFLEARELPVKLPPITPPQMDRGAVSAALQQAKSEAASRIYHKDSQAHYAAKQNEYSAMFSRISFYEFTDQDYERIQQLLAEIRAEVNRAVLIPPEHKRRLLRRLEATKAELHRKTTDIDRFWGFIAEAGIVSRKFGEDLKPLNDRVFELGRIVTGVIMAKEGIQAIPDMARLLQMN